MRTPRPTGKKTAAFASAIAAVFLPAMASCHPNLANTTRFSAEDFQEIGSKMAASLRACDAISGRTPQDAPWTVSVRKVTNLSSDILTPGEQWYAVKKIQSSQPLRQLWDSHHVELVLNAEEAALQTGRQPQEFDANYAKDRKVTHVITATYRSATRNQADARSDMYVCIFEMKELATGKSVWSDEFLIKRQAFGSLRD